MANEQGPRGEPTPSELADRVARDCRALTSRLAALEAAPREQSVQRWQAAAQELQLLASQITGELDRLCRARAGTPLAPAARQLHDRQMAEAVRLLREAAASYARLADTATVMLHDVGRRLNDVQRGGVVLRSYARAARAPS